MTPDASRTFDNVVSNRGMLKKTLLGRLIQWFAEAPGVVQDVALRSHSEDMSAAYADALEAMARQVRERIAKGGNGHGKAQ